jgi:hypothetical protein
MAFLQENWWQLSPEIMQAFQNHIQAEEWYQQGWWQVPQQETQPGQQIQPQTIWQQ